MPRLTAAARGRPLLILTLLASAAPAVAQDPPTPAPAPPPTDAPPPIATESAATGARTYTPADFARFNPRNALEKPGTWLSMSSALRGLKRAKSAGV